MIYIAAQASYTDYHQIKVDLDGFFRSSPNQASQTGAKLPSDYLLARNLEPELNGKLIVGL
jgi:hypothetical protein